LQETVDRLDGWIPLDNLWAVAGESHAPEIRRQLDRFLLPERLIVEPSARNTAPAIAAVASAIEAVEAEAMMLVLPSDHWIPDREAFRNDVERTLRAAEAVDGLHLFGIPIHRPETGYGYVESRGALEGHPGVAPVAHFHEKPDPAKALEYAARPEMYWNSGIFLWKAGTILDALERHIPRTAAALQELRKMQKQEKGVGGPRTAACMQRYFDDSVAESIDYAVLERHEPTFVTRATFRWSDLGGWLAWGEQIDPDPDGNRTKGTVLLREAKNCVLYAQDGALALLGVKDLIVVRLEDVTLVCGRDRAQEVRDLLKEARKRDDMDRFL